MPLGHPHCSRVRGRVSSPLGYGKEEDAGHSQLGSTRPGTQASLAVDSCCFTGQPRTPGTQGKQGQPRECPIPKTPGGITARPEHQAGPAPAAGTGALYLQHFKSSPAEATQKAHGGNNVTGSR